MDIDDNSMQILKGKSFMPLTIVLKRTVEMVVVMTVAWSELLVSPEKVNCRTRTNKM